MADKLSKLAKGFSKAMITRKKKPSGYTATAHVVRVEDKIAWVKLPGSDIETPVTMAVSAKKGDRVTVRIEDHIATLTGNKVAPPTDDTEAVNANEIATEARIISENNSNDVIRAQNAANEAQAYADEAQTQAKTATKYANSALDQLGIVQDVVGVLNWASDHGTFTKTSDTSIVEGKVYFVLDPTTNDYMPVVDPQDSDLSNYYELSVDEAMQTYILSHLAVTQRGLWILPAGIGDAQDEQFSPGYKMLLTSGNNPGMYLYDENGSIVTSYGANSIEFADNRQFHIGTQDAYILFTPASGSTGASISIGGANITLGDNRTLDQVIATVDNTLIYDHTYTYGDLVDGKPTTATFTAFLYRGGVDVKYEMDGDEPKYPPERFTWWLKKEDTDGTKEVPIIVDPLNDPQNSGYQCVVDLNDCGYGAEVIGKFTSLDNAQALDTSGNNLTNVDNEPLSVRATGDSIRVRDLTTSSIIFPTEKVLIVGTEDEHLVTVSTLSDAVDKHYTYNQETPSAEWTVTHNLRKHPSITVVDSAGSEVVGEYNYVSDNEVILTFAGAFAGKAYFN